MFAKLLGKGRFLDADLEDYCLETWAWLLGRLGGVGRLVETPWVTPSRDFFPPTDALGEDRALHLFTCVKDLMGMADWPCELSSYDRQGQQQVGEFLFVSNLEQPNGLFWIEDGHANVQYAADLIAQPQLLTAVFAHELSHYLLAGLPDPPQDDSIAHELATELCVAFTGFGIFSANTAFAFAQHGDGLSQGWRSQRNGYLSDRAWAFALALFGALKGEPAPEKWLKDGLAPMVRDAERYLAKQGAR
ncbi:MAG: hypothetical protein U1C74_33815, partial [Phenylobacterium sp.]|nr:hypothetical protein [Phenylobacterium sp.]